MSAPLSSYWTLLDTTRWTRVGPDFVVMVFVSALWAYLLWTLASLLLTRGRRTHTLMKLRMLRHRAPAAGAGAPAAAAATADASMAAVAHVVGTRGADRDAWMRWLLMWIVGDDGREVPSVPATAAHVHVLPPRGTKPFGGGTSSFFASLAGARSTPSSGFGNRSSPLASSSSPSVSYTHLTLPTIA